MSNDRRLFLGSSDAAPALGLSPYKTPLEVWLEKTGQADTVPPSIPMRMGNALESLVIELFEEETGFKVADRQLHLKNPDHMWMGATLDGITNGNQIVEVKTTGSADGWGDPGTNEIPVHYLVQVFEQMLVSRLEIAWVPVLIGRSDFRIYKVAKDADVMQSILKRLMVFWEKVESRTPPEPTTLEDLNRLYRKDDGTIMQATQDIIEAVSNLKSVKTRIKQLEAEKEGFEKVIKATMMNHTRLLSGDVELATWKSQTTKRLNQDRLKSLYPEIYEECCAESESRVFRIK